MCDCARADAISESNNYKLHFLNRKLITEGISLYFCHQSAFEEKMNVCRQTGASMQSHFINICLRCFEKGACAFIVYVVTVGFPECLLFFDSDKQLNQ